MNITLYKFERLIELKRETLISELFRIKSHFWNLIVKDPYSKFNPYIYMCIWLFDLNIIYSVSKN